jgi:predicted ATPase
LRVGPRWPSRPEAHGRVKRYGQELAAALVVLRNDQRSWNRLITRARAALGPDLSDLLLLPAGAGQLDVAMKLRSRAEALPVRLLSEGQLSFLVMLAVVELGAGRTLLALDEPDIHYHPELVVNLVQILEELATECPIIVATHSDRLLDAVSDPAGAVILCDLDKDGAARLHRPQPERLADWLESYRGLGALRAEGYQPHVFDGGPDAGGEDRVARRRLL